jgi:hypothetical protein
VARAVNMTIVTRVGFILDVGGVDRDAASLFFRRLVNFGVIRELGTSSVGKNLGDGSGKGSLPMINVALGCAGISSYQRI